MEEPYKKFLEEFEENKIKQDGVYFVMKYLQNLAEAKKFEDFQTILDHADPSLFGDAIYTIALVAWWYGEKLNRKDYINRGIEYYNGLKGNGYGQKVFKGIIDGKWESKFGFERKLFGINGTN